MEDLIKIEEVCRQARLALDNAGKTYFFTMAVLVTTLIIAFYHKIPYFATQQHSKYVYRKTSIKTSNLDPKIGSVVV